MLEVTKPQLQKRSVQLYLDTHLEDFKSRQVEFIAQLALALNIDINDMEIINIKSGCVMFTALLPKETADALEQALKLDSLPEEIKLFFDKFNIKPNKTGFDVIAVAPNILKFEQIKQELSAPGRILTWLHISDAHFYINDEQAASWSQDIVKKEFVDKVSELLGGWSLNPDFIFFTGDVAYSGQKEEYKNALDFLTKVKSQFNTNPRIYIVPGNHDVAWDKISREEDENLDKQLNSLSEVNKFILNDECNEARQKNFHRFDNFWEFMNEAATQLDHPPINENYYYWDRFEKSDIKLFIAGFNSAWRSTSKDKKRQGEELDVRNLLLGEPQVLKTIQRIDESHLSIALLHHPPETMWFRDFDRHMQSSLFPKFDFVLRGHEHKTELTKISNINSDDEYIQVAAGALYDPSEIRGIAGYPISFNAVRINVDTGNGVVFYWRYYPEGYRWVKDIITDNGYKIFKLPDGLIDKLRHKSLPPNPSNLGMHAKLT